MHRVWLWLLMLLVCAPAVSAQTSEPIGPFVVDVRGLMSGLPTTEGWTPVLPTGTDVPSRGFGLEGAGHVYFARWGPATLGAGASFSTARGTTTAVAVGTPDVVTRATTLAPQLSFNFGHRLGFSYLSAGYGGAQVKSESAAVGLVPAALAESGWVGAINIGGGARWFLTEHLGVGFEARWHRLSPRDATATSLAAPRATLFHLAVGFSIQ
jgi:opacity protein-like surface antigen